jgi:alpha-glucosidase
MRPDRRLLGLLAASLAACSASDPLALVDPPPAPPFAPPAAVIAVSDADVTLTTGSGRLVVERTPFRMRFYDAAGMEVLSEVENSDAAPMPIAAVLEPAPIGAELPKTPALYAPLAFVVGVQALPQIPAGPWEANALTGTAAGVAFHATEVADVEVADERALLTVATNDPSGRTLQVTISRAENDGLRVQVQADPAGGVALIGDAFAAADDDAFRGFGGRHNALDQRGQDFLGWVMQQNTGAGQLQSLADLVPGGDSQYLFPNGKTAAYYVSPSFVAPRYAFLLERDELSRWRMASDRDDAWQVQVAAPALDFSVVPGAPPQTIAALTELTGRHRPPPDWTLGVILDRSTIAFTQTPAQYEAQVRDDLAQIDALGLRVSGYRIEGWFELAPEIRGPLIADFTGRGIRTLTYFRSFASVDGAGTEDPDTFLDALTNDYVADTILGTPYIYGGNFFGASLLIDFTNPAAVDWWKGRIRAALDEGADGFMQDFGEQTMGDMVFADGRLGSQMHNRYPVVYHRATREAIDEWLLEHPGHDDIWFYTRAGYGGLDGSPHFEGGNFAGDGNTDFSPSSGLQSQTPDMLNRGLNGSYGFTTDIGGYFDYVTPATTKELLIRWAQWATLSPIMRLHGSINAGTHMPWNYDEETVTIWKALTDLRYRAAPYIAQAWRDAYETGMPVARPLWLMFPGDNEAAQQMQEWLLGDDVLVAPVVEEQATSRSVYFPTGCWQHGETGEQFTGPASIDVAAPLDALPFFFRCGRAPF